MVDIVLNPRADTVGDYAQIDVAKAALGNPPTEAQIEALMRAWGQFFSDILGVQVDMHSDNPSVHWELRISGVDSGLPTPF